MSDPAKLLERSQWDFFWVPDDATVVDRPELAFLSTPRPVPPLNTAYRVRASADRTPALVDEVSRSHAEYSRFQIVDTIDLGPLERALVAAGYEHSGTGIGSVIEPASFEPVAPGTFRVARVSTLEQMRDSVAVMDQAFGLSVPFSDDKLADMLSKSVGDAARVWRFVAYDSDGQPVSNGSINHHQALGLGLLWGGSTIPAARGRGAYRAVLAARMEAARAAGIGMVGLYAMEKTSAPIVARLGFRDVGRMYHWVRRDRLAT